MWALCCPPKLVPKGQVQHMSVKKNLISIPKITKIPKDSILSFKKKIFEKIVQNFNIFINNIISSNLPGYIIA
jgi:hypothetical protein